LTSTKSPETFGAWVRTRRRQLDLTQAELGRRAGCSEAAIRKIEADERRPSLQLAELMARALEIPAADGQLFLQFARGVYIETLSLEPRAESHPNNLPAFLTPTIDRARDLAHVLALLAEADHHLITIIGPPGIGKTRLSIHCGREALSDFPDGAWFVDLAEIDNPDFFIPAIARSLGTLDLPPSPDLVRLLDGLKNKKLLLILDNFEHIVEKAALDVAQILKACRHLKILVTSRVPLHIYGENEYPLPPLSVPPREGRSTPEELMQFESVQLLAARIRQHQPQFRILPGNVSEIVEICNILDGIPLAIELAAASLRRMTLGEMVSLLRGRNWVREISTPARDLPQRQRTLENVIDWSYSLLTEQQRVFFCKLGVFSGWFDAEAVSAVCQQSLSKSIGFLNALTDHSLLMHDVIKGVHYWRMLELIHEYAQTRLSGRNQVELLRAEFYLGKLRELEQSAARSVQEDYVQINFGNLHSAYRWAIAEGKMDLCFQLFSELDKSWLGVDGYLKEGLDLIQQFLALPSGIDPLLRLKYMQSAADLAWQQHNFEVATSLSREAVNYGLAHGLQDEYIHYLNRLGRIYIEQGMLTEAKETLNECFELATRNPSTFDPAWPLTQLGEVALFEGRLEEAKSILENVLPHLSEFDDDYVFIPMAQTDLAEIALAQCDFPRARFWLSKAHATAKQQIRRTLIFLCALAGYLALAPDGDKERSAQFYGAITTFEKRAGVVLGAFYQKLNQERMRLVRENLSEKEWLAGFKAGRGWDRSEAIEQAKKELVQ
jgi:predicted ATPase/DNA-binding XRE family transcriptional regulator